MKHILYLFFFLNLTNTFSQTTAESEDVIYSDLEKAKDLKRILDFNEALNLCNKALSLADEIDSDEYEAKTYQLIGEIYLENKQYEEALRELKKAYRIQQSKGYLEDFAKTQNTLGLVHTELKQYAQAENYFDSASKIYKRLQINSSNTTIIKNKGKLYLKKKSYWKANKTFKQAYSLADKFQLEATKAEILLYNSKALNGLKQSKNAIDNCQKAIAIGEANGLNFVVDEGYRTISQIYESNHNYKKAYENIMLHNTLRDSIYDINKQRLTAEEAAKLNFADQDRLLEQKELIIQQNTEQIELNKIMTALGIALLLLFLTFLMFLYFSNQKRKKANSLLQNTNEQLIKAKEEAELATKAKANFLSTITHELRTPLFTVTGLTDLLLEENPTPAQEGHLKSLRFSGDYLLNFINDILDVNKIEANKIELESIPFNIKSHTKKVLYALNKLAKDNGTELHFDFDKTIPKIVMGDSLRLSQILFNLVNNAIKFTKKGDVTLRITNQDTTTLNTTLLFEIIDTGIGISYQNQESIFESFSQGSVQINRKYGGTGLGLTIVKNLLDLMKSEIKLKSIPEKGATFYFELTLEIAQSELEVNDKTTSISEAEMLKLVGKQILLVEDVKINQLITQKTLEKKQIKCITADNGEDAVKYAKQNNFDLILMDLHMPGISGIEATKQIREFNKNVPIIALTALTIEEEELEDFNNAGFDDTLPKPFKNEVFFQKIYSLIFKL